MINKDYALFSELPLYEVKELSMEEALLVLAAEKESLQQTICLSVLMPERCSAQVVSLSAGSAAA
ncbi:hypothetical protein [Sedimenticola sp.]|uniref:hypothetical protein n=1 Tax=Sedimenticola sp. TaxID=1940285 RepID=UPI003D0A61B0